MVFLTKNTAASRGVPEEHGLVVERSGDVRGVLLEHRPEIDGGVVCDDLEDHLPVSKCRTTPP